MNKQDLQHGSDNRQYERITILCTRLSNSLTWMHENRELPWFKPFALEFGCIVQKYFDFLTTTSLDDEALDELEIGVHGLVTFAFKEHPEITISDFFELLTISSQSLESRTNGREIPQNLQYITQNSQEKTRNRLTKFENTTLPPKNLIPLEEFKQNL